MKICHTLLCVATGSELYKSCLSKSNKIEEGSVQNGSVDCKGATCTLNCKAGYSSYGGYTRAKCIVNRKTGKSYWSRSKLGSCRTCNELEIHHGDMEMDCSYTSQGAKKCIVSCRNKQGIKPINNDKVVAMCRCTYPPKSQVERDGKCHWRVGVEKIVDAPSFSKDYVKNWFCTKETKLDQSGQMPLSIEHAVAISSRPPEHRIPPGLVCRSGANGYDRIVGGVSAIPHSWPWIVNMAFGQFMCGGTILDDETVVTAAHCCDG